MPNVGLAGALYVSLTWAHGNHLDQSVNPFLTSGLIHPYNLSILIFWTSPFVVLGFLIFTITVFSIEISIRKQNRPQSDALFCGIFTASALFAYVP